jgi:catechol 2,3-dioxygenase-like lactoylglutathione lyase family enzyme
VTDADAGFELRGINHLALVCRDMKVTVEFYRDVLGMPLIKTIELPGGLGQHFFFDCGGGDALAFFWFPGAPDAVPGLTAPKDLPDRGEIVSAVGGMNHVAFDVAPERIEEYRERLLARGVDVGVVLNHDDSAFGIARDVHDGVYIRSIYFRDPDGVLLEFAAWRRRPDGRPSDIAHEPRTAADRTATARTARPTS